MPLCRVITQLSALYAPHPDSPRVGVAGRNAIKRSSSAEVFNQHVAGLLEITFRAPLHVCAADDVIFNKGVETQYRRDCHWLAACDQVRICQLVRKVLANLS